MCMYVYGNNSKMKSRGKVYLVIMYKYPRKKSANYRNENVCYYSETWILEIIFNIICNCLSNLSETKKEKLILAKNSVENDCNKKIELYKKILKKCKLDLFNLSKRNVSLFWSIYHTYYNQYEIKLINDNVDISKCNVMQYILVNIIDKLWPKLFITHQIEQDDTVKK